MACAAAPILGALVALGPPTASMLGNGDLGTEGGARARLSGRVEDLVIY